MLTHLLEKKTLEMLSFITSSFASSVISEKRLWIESLERYIRLIFASLASPKCSFTLFGHQGFTSLSPIVCVFLAWQFQERLHMMPVFLVKSSGAISLWRFKLASWHRKNSQLFVACLGYFVFKCRINLAGFINSALRVFQTTAILFFLNVDCNFATINC